MREHPEELAGASPQLSRALVRHALAAYADGEHGQGGAVAALLRRYDVEAARDEARELADVLADTAAVASQLSRMPDLIEEELRPDRLLAA